MSVWLPLLSARRGNRAIPTIRICYRVRPMKWLPTDPTVRRVLGIFGMPPSALI